MGDQQIYSPLPKPTSVRLLKIAPGNPSDDIVCELVPVDSLEHAPTYEALSYAWGDPTVTIPIICNGITRNITTNLAAALRRFRKLADPRTASNGNFDVLLQEPSTLHTVGEEKLPSFAKRLRPRDPILLSTEGLLWIDALCINQEDLVEKSAQVSLMPEIYRSAQRVIVWIGEESGDTVNALKMLSIGLSCYHKESPEGAEKYIPNREAVLRDTNTLRGFPDIESSSWVALSQFVSLPWFSRGWIIQEVVLSRSCVMFIGDLEFNWKAVGRATYWMEYKGYSYVDFEDLDLSSLTLSAAIWELQASPCQLKLTTLLRRTKLFRTTLPQDKIYSLLALAIDPLDSARWPDYSKPAPHVFRTMAKSLIEEDQNLFVLTEVDHGANLLDYVSSWVPTWVSSKGTPADIGTTKFAMFRADKGRRLTFHCSQSLEVIHLGGVLLDSISYHTDIVTEFLNFSQTAQQRLIWDTMTEKVGGAQRSYISNPRISMGIAFTLVLTQGVDQYNYSAGGNPEYYIDAAAYWKKVGANDLQNLCLREALSPENARNAKASRIGNLDPFIVAVRQATSRRRIFLTTTGYLGVGPEAMRLGDQVCILYGSSHPFILRPHEDRHRLVGACYVQGIMQGEAIERLEAENTDTTRTFAIF